MESKSTPSPINKCSKQTEQRSTTENQEHFNTRVKKAPQNLPESAMDSLLPDEFGLYATFEHQFSALQADDSSLTQPYHPEEHSSSGADDHHSDEPPMHNTHHYNHQLSQQHRPQPVTNMSSHSYYANPMVSRSSEVYLSNPGSSVPPGFVPSSSSYDLGPAPTIRSNEMSSQMFGNPTDHGFYHQRSSMFSAGEKHIKEDFVPKELKSNLRMLPSKNFMDDGYNAQDSSQKKGIAKIGRKKKREMDDEMSGIESSDNRKLNTDLLKQRGRPRLDTRDETAADRRRTQIRLAQRKYRLRKETTIASLRSKVTELQTAIEGMQAMFLELHDVTATIAHKDANEGQPLKSTLNCVKERFLCVAKTALAKGGDEGINSADEDVDGGESQSGEETVAWSRKRNEVSQTRNIRDYGGDRTWDVEQDCPFGTALGYQYGTNFEQ